MNLENVGKLPVFFSLKFTQSLIPVFCSSCDSHAHPVAMSLLKYFHPVSETHLEDEHLHNINK